MTTKELSPLEDPIKYHAQVSKIKSIDDLPEYFSPFPETCPFSLGELFVIAWQYRLLDENHFHWHLAKALATGDDYKIQRLAVGFPEIVEAFLRYRLQPGWWSWIEGRAIKYKLVREAISRADT